MKRPGPLRPGKPLERRTPLQRGAPLKRRPKPKATALETRLRNEWKGGVGRHCACCGKPPKPEENLWIQGHHIVRKQLLVTHLKPLIPDRDELAAILWDPRNRLDVREDHHMAHHRRLPALKWSLIEELAPEAIVFAEEVKLLWRAKLDYDLEGR